MQYKATFHLVHPQVPHIRNGTTLYGSQGYHTQSCYQTLDHHKDTRTHSQQWLPYHWTSVRLSDFCFLVATALRTPACRHFFTESRCVTHTSSSSVLRRVCFASSSVSSEFKSPLSFRAFSKLFLITVLL